MEKSDVFRINKISSHWDKSGKNKKKRNTKTKTSGSNAPEDETKIPGMSDIQRINQLPNIQGTLNDQNVNQVVQPQYQYPNYPQQMIPYQSPSVVNNMQIQIVPITNQISPVVPPVIKFGISPLQIICPYCNQNVVTKTEEIFNYTSCCLFCFFLILIPVLIVLLAMSGCFDASCCQKDDSKKEECNCKCCYDVKHYCPNCNKIIGIRNSKEEICSSSKKWFH